MTTLAGKPDRVVEKLPLPDPLLTIVELLILTPGVRDHITPREMIGTPPSLITFPPVFMVLANTLLSCVVITTGLVACCVVKETVLGERLVFTAFRAYARK